AAPVQPFTAPTVTVTATTATTTDQSGATPAVYTVTRTGSTAAPLAVFFQMSGTASSPPDYGLTGTSGTNTVMINSGQSSANVTLTAADDFKFEGLETAVMTLQTPMDGSYNVGNPGSATVDIIDGLPTQVPSSSCGCGGGGGTTKICQAPGVADNP